MRGRKATPVALKLVTGNPGRRPIGEEPEMDNEEDEAPEAPAFLTAYAKEEWARMVSKLHGVGLMTHADVGALAAYCQAYGRWRAAEEAYAVYADKDPVTKAFIVKTSSGNTVQNPLVGIANRAMTDMVRYATEFGMSPSSRARVAQFKRTKDSGSGKPKKKGVEKYFG